MRARQGAALLASMPWVVACTQGSQLSVADSAGPARSVGRASPSSLVAGKTVDPGSLSADATTRAEREVAPPDGAATRDAGTEARARAICRRFDEELSALGDATAYTRDDWRGEDLTEQGAWCWASVAAPASDYEPCSMRVYETVGAATAFLEALQRPLLGGPPLAAELSPGTFAYTSADQLEVFWCGGGGKLDPRIVQLGRNFVERSRW